MRMVIGPENVSNFSETAEKSRDALILRRGLVGTEQCLQVPLVSYHALPTRRRRAVNWLTKNYDPRSIELKAASVMVL
jgi:hypothetical protein